MQYCTNCGKQLKENQQFCPNCGHPVMQRGAASPAVSIGGPNPPKKRGWVTPVIIVSCVLAVLLIALLVVGYLLLGWFRAPHERLIAYKNTVASVAAVEIRSTDYGAAVSTDSELRFDVSDVVLPDYVDSSVYYLVGMDTATLLNAVSADINVDYDPDGSRGLVELMLSLSGSELMGYTFTADDNGIGLYSDRSERYGIVSWDTLGIENPLSAASQISPVQASELLLAFSDACDALLTKDSVSYQRNYSVDTGIGERKMGRYVIDPGRAEWKDFLIRMADLIENDPVASNLAVAYWNEYGAGSGSDPLSAAELAEQIRENASDTAKLLAASDIRLQLYVSGKRLCCAALTVADDAMKIKLNVSDYRVKSEGLRACTLTVEQDGSSLLTVSVQNPYARNADSEEEGEITGTFTYPDESLSAVISGTYDTSSDFSARIDITEDGSEDTAALYLDHTWRGNDEAKKGALTFGMDAPYMDVNLSLTVEYDIDLTKKSILHVPYGSYELLTSVSGTGYDEIINGMTLTLDVSASQTGSAHRLTVQGLIVDEVEIRDAAIILITSDQPSTADYPSAAPEYGGTDLLTEILQGGLPTDLW